MGVFSKIGKSIKKFAKSDVFKAAVVLGGGAMFGPSLLAKGKLLIPEKGLMGLKGKLLEKGGKTALSSIMGGGGGTSSYGGSSRGYSTTAEAGLTTYSPEGAQTVSAPGASDYDSILRESLQLYAYAETQGRKIT